MGTRRSYAVQVRGQALSREQLSFLRATLETKKFANHQLPANYIINIHQQTFLHNKNFALGKKY